MRQFNEDKDGELWDAVIEWLYRMGVKVPKERPLWVHKDSSAGNPTFFCAMNLSVYVLAFKRKDEWTITSLMLKRCDDE